MEDRLIYIFSLNLALALFIFIIVSYAAWWFTEGHRSVPSWLDYKPFSCRMCLTFWSLAFVYGSLIYLGNVTCGVIGLIIAVLNAAAMYIDERNKIKKGKELYDNI